MGLPPSLQVVVEPAVAIVQQLACVLVGGIESHRLPRRLDRLRQVPLDRRIVQRFPGKLALMQVGKATRVAST